MRKETISIAVPCYNVENYIGEVVESILELNHNFLEILLINDGSTDRTNSIIKKIKSNKIKVINHPFNMGLSTVRNTAIVNAKGDYIAFIDGDVMVEKDWLTNMMKGFRRNIAGVGGCLNEKYTNSAPNKWRSIHMSQAVKKSGPSSLLPGCNCVFKKDKLIKVGMYDTANRTNGEDILICSRLGKSGYGLWQESSAKCWHLRKDDIYSVIKTRWGWGNAKTDIKGPNVYSLSALLFKCLIGLGWSIKCLKTDIKGRHSDLYHIDFFIPFFWSYYTLTKYMHHKRQEFKSIKNSVSNF